MKKVAVGLVIVIFLFTRLYRLDQSFFFFNEMGREMWLLAQWRDFGKPPILGPQTSALPFNQSPWYYYILYPGFLLYNQPVVLVYSSLVFYLICFLLAVEIEKSGSKIEVINFHGIFAPGSKLDTPLRIEQSKKLLKMLRKIGSTSTVLLGDFNLEPKTKSIEMLSKKLVNLNRKFMVTDTRGEGNVRHWGKPTYQPYADYGFASEDLAVKSFEAKEVVISDHKPLVLEIED